LATVSVYLGCSSPDVKTANATRETRMSWTCITEKIIKDCNYYFLILIRKIVIIENLHDVGVVVGGGID
jgi:hypothetical protein